MRPRYSTYLWRKMNTKWFEYAETDLLFFFASFSIVQCDLEDGLLTNKVMSHAFLRFQKANRKTVCFVAVGGNNNLPIHNAPHEQLHWICDCTSCLSSVNEPEIDRTARERRDLNSKLKFNSVKSTSQRSPARMFIIFIRMVVQSFVHSFIHK